ncbi:DUF2752 domain-containing protein [Pedobacter nototheniae]|uniref:DUF2752 domain-containing protein n=1 Tax=Pedobacter nototheniae TaxID=2488994 RepID=UPI00292DBA65|nr:DUF2752 domain-containing protein [Pedobacter nototheniae]
MKLNHPETTFAFRTVWIIISILALLIILASKFVNPDYFNLMPTCTSKLNQETCSFCGMTRAFIQIGSLNFKEALVLNKGSIVLFTAMLFNGFIFFAYSTFKLINHFQTKNSKQ